jgi:hypothetical protein
MFAGANLSVSSQSFDVPEGQPTIDFRANAEWLGTRADQHQLAAKPVDQRAHRLAVGRRCENHPSSAQSCQFFRDILGLRIDVNAGASLARDVLLPCRLEKLG